MNFKATLTRYRAGVFVVCTFLLSVAATFAPVGDADKFYVLAALIVPIPTMVALALAAVTGGVRAFLRETLSSTLHMTTFHLFRSRREGYQKLSEFSNIDLSQ